MKLLIYLLTFWNSNVMSTVVLLPVVIKYILHWKTVMFCVSICILNAGAFDFGAVLFDDVFLCSQCGHFTCS